MHKTLRNWFKWVHSSLKISCNKRYPMQTIKLQMGFMFYRKSGIFGAFSFFFLFLWCLLFLGCYFCKMVPLLTCNFQMNMIWFCSWLLAFRSISCPVGHLQPSNPGNFKGFSIILSKSCKVQPALTFLQLKIRLLYLVIDFFC